MCWWLTTFATIYFRGFVRSTVVSSKVNGKIVERRPTAVIFVGDFFVWAKMAQLMDLLFTTPLSLIAITCLFIYMTGYRPVPRGSTMFYSFEVFLFSVIMVNEGLST